MSFEEMDTVINEFLDDFWGTEWAEEIYNKRLQIWDGDTEEMEKLYEKYKHIIS